MSELENIINKYKISKERKKQLITSDALIIPISSKNGFFIEAIDILKILNSQKIQTEYLIEKKEDISILEYRGVETEVIILILSIPLNLFLGVLGNWIYHKYVETDDKNTILKVKIYENKKEKIKQYEFEGKAQEVLEAIEKVKNK